MPDEKNAMARLRTSIEKLRTLRESDDIREKAAAMTQINRFRKDFPLRLDGYLLRMGNSPLFHAKTTVERDVLRYLSASYDSLDAVMNENIKRNKDKSQAYADRRDAERAQVQWTNTARMFEELAEDLWERVKKLTDMAVKGELTIEKAEHQKAEARTFRHKELPRRYKNRPLADLRGATTPEPPGTSSPRSRGRPAKKKSRSPRKDDLPTRETAKGTGENS